MHGEQSMAITLTHGGPTIFTASAPSNEVLVGTLHGLVWLERHQGGWREARRELEELHISAALFEPESGTLFATAFHSRISMSEDGGRTWRPLQGGLLDLTGNVEAMCLEDWDCGFSLFAATTSGEVLASDDGGDKWSTIARELGPVSKGDHYKLLQ